jgi:hypothetical protein
VNGDTELGTTNVAKLDNGEGWIRSSTAYNGYINFHKSAGLNWVS